MNNLTPDMQARLDTWRKAGSKPYAYVPRNIEYGSSRKMDPRESEYWKMELEKHSIEKGDR